jgi:hypothetical protein
LRYFAESRPVCRRQKCCLTNLCERALVLKASLTLEEVRQRYGANTPRRQFLFDRLQVIAGLLSATGQLRQLYLLGSFTTAKPLPNDLDCFAVMTTGFTTEHLRSPQAEVFQHDTCRLLYQTDVFWVTEAVGQDGIADMLAVFSRDRTGATQPIIEVTL